MERRPGRRRAIAAIARSPHAIAPTQKMRAYSASDRLDGELVVARRTRREQVPAR